MAKCYENEILDVHERGYIHPALCLPEILEAVLQHLNAKDQGNASQVCRDWRDILQRQTAWRNAWATVLQYLRIRDKGNAAQVCRDWRDILNQSSVWSNNVLKLKVSRHYPYSFPSTQSHIRRGITRLELRGAWDLSSELFNFMPNLTELDLRQYKLLTGELEMITEQLPCLHSLNISGRECSCPGDGSLKLISACLLKLRRLCLCDCKLITDVGVGYLVGRNLGAINTKKPKLNRLSLPFRKINTGLGVTWDEGPANSSHSTLEHLTLSSCTGLTEKSLLYLRMGKSRITSISLQSSSGVTATGLHHLAEMESLRKVNLSHCKISVEGLAHLASGNAKITSLILDYCKGVTDDGMKHVGKMLELSELSIVNCRLVTAEGLWFLQSDNGKSKITSLNVAFCERIDSEIMWNLVIGLIQLHFLGMDETQILANWMIPAADHLQNLHTFIKYVMNHWEKSNIIDFLRIYRTVMLKE